MISAGFLTWFLETSIAVSVLILAVLILRRRVAKRFGAEAAYLLWLAPIARLLTPELSILPSSWRAPAPAAAFYGDVMPIASAAAPAGPEPLNLSLVVFAVWFAGALAFIAYQLFVQQRFMDRVLRRSRDMTPEIRAEALTIADRVGVRNPPPIRIASENIGPLVAGVLRPSIILPDNFGHSYTSAERQLAFAHEYAHIKRGDLWMNLAALLFRAAQWPNPLVHAAFQSFRADQEAACDASVLLRNGAGPDASYAYGAALLKSATMFRPAPAASLAMSNHLKERLMLLKNARKSSAAVGRVVAASLIAAGVAASASYSYAAAGKDAEWTAKEEKKVVSVSVIKADGDEAIEIDGIKGAKKVEIQTENGVKTVKVWDKNGKLLSEKTMKPGEGADQSVTIVTADGKSKTIAIGKPDEFDWTSEMVAGDEHGEHRVRKVVVVDGDGAAGHFIGDCSPEGGDTQKMVFSNKEDSGTGETYRMKQIVCLDGEAGADPSKRAEALRKVIDRMEADGKREAEHRAKMMATLKEELAKAEKEAAKKK